MVFSDVLIGYTEIDLEDRFFSQRFRSLTDIPIEIRQLTNDSSEVSMGDASMWIEVFKSREKSK